METKIRLLQLGKKQVDLLAEIHKRGYPAVSPAMLSDIIHKRLNTKRADLIRALCDKILDEWEKERGEK